MRPGEIAEAIHKGPYAFIPISPMFEWHSFHLPMGTDALITEELARQVASRMEGSGSDHYHSDSMHGEQMMRKKGGA